MKNVILILFLMVISSCSSIYMITKEKKAPTPGNAIIYGQISEMPGFNNSISINLYDRKNDKFYNLAVKISLYVEKSLPFAYELPAGIYDVFSLQNNYMITYNQGGQAIDYLVKNPNDYYRSMNLGPFVDTTKVFKELEHDTISIAPNTVVYVGDWKYKHPKLDVSYDKESTDVLIRKSFDNLDLSNSITVQLNSRAIINLNTNKVFMTNEIISKGSTNLKGEWEIYKINNVKNTKWNVQSMLFSEKNLIFKVENNGKPTYMVNYYMILSNNIFIKEHHNDLYWLNIMMIDGKDAIIIGSLSNNSYFIFKRTSSRISNVYENMLKEYVSSDKDIPQQMDDMHIAMRLEKNELSILDEMFTNTMVYNYSNFTFYVYRPQDRSEIDKYRIHGLISDVLLVKAKNGKKRFLFSRGNIRNVDQLDEKKFQIDGMDFGEFTDNSGMFSYIIGIKKNGEFELLDE